MEISDENDAHRYDFLRVVDRSDNNGTDEKPVNPAVPGQPIAAIPVPDLPARPVQHT
jgi:hypothetical protein